ncbi:hypothetical protein Tco_0373488 [Tanacetum coccineum]
MVSFRQLHSHLKLLSNNDLQGTRTESGFKRAFATLLGQDIETFTGTMFLNVDQLEKQLDKDEFQEIESMAAFKVLETQFQMFIKSWMYMDDEYVVMTRNYFLKYTQLEIPEFRDTLIQHMEFVKKSIGERAKHKQDSGTALKEQDTSNRSGNDAHADDTDIRPIYDEEPMAEVQTTAEINVFATGQQHTEQPEFNNEGELRVFASQVDVNNDLSKPVTTHYLPKERESACAKPHHMIAPGSSRYNSNDMVHKHYLEEAKKKTQESSRNSEPSVMPSARSQSTTNGSKPKPRINNQKSRNWPASKSSCVTTKTVPIAEHSRNSRRYMKRIVNSSQLLRKLKLVSNGSNLFQHLERTPSAYALSQRNSFVGQKIVAFLACIEMTLSVVSWTLFWTGRGERGRKHGGDVFGRKSGDVFRERSATHKVTEGSGDVIFAQLRSMDFICLTGIKR